jgi:hypothetical protein
VVACAGHIVDEHFVVGKQKRMPANAKSLIA